MEFHEFCEQKNRMCSKYACVDCPLYEIKENGLSCNDICMKYCYGAEEIVGEWVKDHPLITNGDKFKEVFGLDINITDGGTLHIDIRNYMSWLKSEYKPPQK